MRSYIDCIPLRGSPFSLGDISIGVSSALLSHQELVPSKEKGVLRSPLQASATRTIILLLGLCIFTASGTVAQVSKNTTVASNITKATEAADPELPGTSLDMPPTDIAPDGECLYVQSCGAFLPIMGLYVVTVDGKMHEIVHTPPLQDMCCKKR